MIPARWLPPAAGPAESGVGAAVFRSAPEDLAAMQAALLGWYAGAARDLPWRRTRDPYAVLVSEVMLQQTQVERVLPKYAEFLEVFPTVFHLAAAPRAEVIRRWAPLGYNLRAVRLHQVAGKVAGELGGRFPDTVAGLLTLKGIGPYTAGAVACFAFGRREAFIDTNIRRVLARVCFGEAAPRAVPPVNLTAAAAALLPADAYTWNQALMDLGARTCRAVRPRCDACPLARWCRFRAAGAAAPTLQAAEAPVPYRIGGRFEGSRRYYRGRVIAALRAGSPQLLAALGAAVRPGYGPGDEAWLTDLVAGLVRDGLVCWSPAGSHLEVALP